MTEDELYTRQMVSPSRLATLSTVSSGKERSGGTGTVLVTITCAPAARGHGSRSPLAPAPGSRHLVLADFTGHAPSPVGWRALPYMLSCRLLSKGAMPFESVLSKEHDAPMLLTGQVCMHKYQK